MNAKSSLTELIGMLKSPGWRHVPGEGGQETTGTLEETARTAHAQNAKGAGPGLVQRIENTIELDMLQLEMLWREIGLPE